MKTRNLQTGEEVTHTTPDIFKNFSTFPSLPLRMGLFENPELIQAAISQFITYELKKAKREGIKEAFETIEGEMRKQADDYVSLITKITDFVSDTANEQVGKSDFKITKVRTNFYFETQQINVLFIIDADPEAEKSFSGFLNGVEEAILGVENSIAELFYINERSGNLDEIPIEADYPCLYTEERGRKP